MASNLDGPAGQSCDKSNEDNENNEISTDLGLGPNLACEGLLQVEDAGGLGQMDERPNSSARLENVIQKLGASEIMSETPEPSLRDNQSPLDTGPIPQTLPEVVQKNVNGSPESNPSLSEDTTDPSSSSGSSRHEVNEMGDGTASSENANVSMLMSEENGNDDDIFASASTSSSDGSSSSSTTDLDSVVPSYTTCFRSRKRTSNASSHDSSEATGADLVLGKEKPKHKWFMVQDVVNRQLGVGAGYYGADLFRQRFYSSLHAVQRLELMYKLENHNGCVNTLNFNSSGSILASGSDDLNVVLWNWAAGRSIAKYKSGHRSNVFQAKFLPLAGDTHVVSCSRDGQIRLAQLSSTGACLSTKKLAAHCGAVHKLAVQNDTPHVFLSCGEDALVMSIDVREEKPNRLIFVRDDQRKIALYGIHSNPYNSNEFCVNGRNNYVRVYDVRMITNSGPLKKFCPQHLMFAKSVTQITCAMFNYNGSEIIASYNDEDIYLFNTDKADEENYKYKFEGHRNNMTVKGVNFFGPKSEYIVSGSDCGNIYFWDKITQAIVQWMPGDEGGVVNCLEPHPYIPVIATSGLDSDVKIWVPSNEGEPTMDGLREVMLDNYKARLQEQQYHPSSGNPLMVLWRRHMRRVDRMRENQNEPDGTQPENESEQTTSSDEESDNEPPFEQCTTS